MEKNSKNFTSVTGWMRIALPTKWIVQIVNVRVKNDVQVADTGHKMGSE